MIRKRADFISSDTHIGERSAAIHTFQQTTPLDQFIVKSTKVITISLIDSFPITW